METSGDDGKRISDAWRRHITAQLEPGEIVVASARDRHRPNARRKVLDEQTLRVRIA